MVKDKDWAYEVEKLSIACKDVFSSTNGKFLLASLKSFAGIDRQLSPDKTIDPYAVVFHEGKRAIIIYIMQLINKDLNKPQQKDAK